MKYFGIIRPIQVLGALIPASFGRLPYWLGFQAVRRRLGTFGWKARVWARNSYLTEALTPFVSDLDMTLWSEDDSIVRVSRLFAGDLREMKRAYPFLGELNVFSSFAREFVSSANPIELRRDPTLVGVLNIPLRAPTQIEGAVFLLRMIEADAVNLTQRPFLRRRKWRRHVRDVSELFPAVVAPKDLSLASLIDYAVRLTGGDPNWLIPEVTRYIHAAGQGRDIYEIGVTEQLQVCFTHRYCYKPPAVGPLAEFCQEMVKANIGWEIWGLLGQAYWLHVEPVFTHIENLKQFVIAAVAPSREREEMLGRLSRLVDFIRPLGGNDI